MVKINRKTLFDRLSLYRYVAILLLPVFVASTIRAFTETYPITWRVYFFWVANVLLWVAVVRDTWEVVKVRREIHKSLREAMDRGDRDGTSRDVT
jgi:general stress protein CsbA